MDSKKFYLKELLLIALTVAGVFSISYLLLPVMLMFPIFIYKPLLVAPIYSVLVYMLVYNIRKPGTITLFSTLLGLILFFISPKMFLIPVVSGILTEIFVLAVHRGYSKEQSILVASSIFPAIQIPISLLLMVVIGGEVYKKAFDNLGLVAFFTILSFGYGVAVVSSFTRLINKKMSPLNKN